MMQKTPLVLIGNSPSSGSTFLADLLDSSNLGASGPESGIFLQPSWNNWEEFKNSIEKTTVSKTYYRVKNFPVYNGLYGWGIDKNRLHQMIISSNSNAEFKALFSKRFLALRGKNENGTVFEKTPENMGNISSILLSETPFLVIHRNPIHVIKSLKRRGFSTYKALSTWMIDVAHYLKHEKNPLVRAISYEELLENPFKITSEIISFYSGNSESSEELQQRYENNSYRNYFAVRVESWENQEIGVSTPILKPFTKEDIKLLKRIQSARISKTAAKIYDVEPLTFKQIITRLKYDNLLPIVEKKETPSAMSLTTREKLKLSRKFAHGVKSGQLLATSWKSFYQPIKF
jgi:hypothetical protein